MKKLKLAKVIASALVVASVLVLNPIGASAEWRQDSNGWWNTEGNSWSIGWKEIDGKWYYFYDTGYMAHDTTIEGYKLDSNGALIINQPTTSKESDFTFDATTGTIIKYVGTDTTVVIPSTINGVSVTSIGKEAFWNCNLTSITIPNSVTSIGDYAFWNCTQLTNINSSQKNIDKINREIFRPD